MTQNGTKLPRPAKRGSAAAAPITSVALSLKMRQKAEQAQLVIVNHHLFFADLALRGPHPGRVLPNYEVVIFDEAHQLEDIATDFFGVKVSSQALIRTTRDLERAFEHFESLGFGAEKRAVSNLAGQLNGAMNEFFELAIRCANDGEGRREVDVESLHARARDAWLRLDSILEALAALAEAATARLHGARTGYSESRAVGLKDAIDIGIRRIAEFRDRLQELMETSRGRVVWTERGDRGVSLTSSPVDFADLLRTKIFEVIPSVVLTSATLTTFPGFSETSKDKQFEYVRARLGLIDGVVPVEQIVVSSPFRLQAPRALVHATRFTVAKYRDIHHRRGRANKEPNRDYRWRSVCAYNIASFNARALQDSQGGSRAPAAIARFAA